MPVAEQVSGYRDRIQYLQNALRYFAELERTIDVLMRSLCLYETERSNLKEKIEIIIENCKKADPGNTVDLHIIFETDEVKFVALNGVQKHRLNLSQKQRDHVLDIMSETKQMIQKRISSDKAIIKKLDKTI